jgi:hypothetical protein
MHPDPFRRYLNRRLERSFGWLAVFEGLYLAGERFLRGCWRLLRRRHG